MVYYEDQDWIQWIGTVPLIQSPTQHCILILILTVSYTVVIHCRNSNSTNNCCYIVFVVLQSVFCYKRFLVTSLPLRPMQQHIWLLGFNTKRTALKKIAKYTFFKVYPLTEGLKLWFNGVISKQYIFCPNAYVIYGNTDKNPSMATLSISNDYQPFND